MSSHASSNSNSVNEPIVCLVSGGMDSLVAAAMGISLHAPAPVHFLHVNYGQKTEKKELASFHLIADHYRVPQSRRRTIDLSFLSQIGGSSLTDDKIEVKRYKGDSPEIPDSYVPFRNSIMLSMAVSWAEVTGSKRIYIGAVHEDSSGYPDCRPSYYRAFNQLIKEGSKTGDIEIATPIIHLSKDKIVLKALELAAPLQHTWSCYAREDLACGICDSCALRLKGFKRAGQRDPIAYAERPDYSV